MRDPSYEIAKALYLLLNENPSIEGAPKAFSSLPKGLTENYIYIGPITQQPDRAKDKYVGDVSFDIWVVTPKIEQAANKGDMYKIANDVLTVLKTTPTDVLSLGDSFSMVGLYMESVREDESTTEQGITYRKVLSLGAFVTFDLADSTAQLVDTVGNLLVDTVGNNLIL